VDWPRRGLIIVIFVVHVVIHIESVVAVGQFKKISKGNLMVMSELMLRSEVVAVVV